MHFKISLANISEFKISLFIVSIRSSDYLVRIYLIDYMTEILFVVTFSLKFNVIKGV